ncbi:MAG: hypothetical protein MPEBLZ_00570 [Candidatus Methanoperedens nitroreducens]|uniref:Uncharacterized protein n=1 Tax=Candidatus Methanoperedens nitratireducens TaxID=1392998 RepID=A0A0P8A977_9EURY|nr:MAG: hypothetical protein MPEBLZ_00570 [Candidatus Methanoperedens sp. BLZ1]
MGPYIDEDFADLIKQETEYEWDDLKKGLSRISDSSIDRDNGRTRALCK